MHTRCVSVGTTVHPTFQERRCENSRRSTREQSTPTQAPTLLSSALQHCWLRPCSCLCQVPNERHCFERPPASNFESNHHQLGPVPLLDEFRVGPLLAAWLPQEQLRLCPLPHVWRSRRNGGQRQGSCRSPTGPHRAGRPSTTTSKRRASFTATGRSRSRTNKLVAALPPASRHTRAAAHSTANPRLPRTPACAHDAR